MVLLLQYDSVSAGLVLDAEDCLRLDDLVADLRRVAPEVTSDPHGRSSSTSSRTNSATRSPMHSVCPSAAVIAVADDRFVPGRRLPAAGRVSPLVINAVDGSPVASKGEGETGCGCSLQRGQSLLLAEIVSSTAFEEPEPGPSRQARSAGPST